MLLRVLAALAVLALAVGTWLLSAPGHRPAEGGAEAERALPGYYAKQAVLTEYDAAGNPSIRVQAERIDQVDHGDEVALSGVRVDYHGRDGREWALFGDGARILPGGNVIDVQGNVRLQAQGDTGGGMPVIHADTLRYDVAAARASTPGDVRIEYGPHTLTARGLVANLKDETLRLESKVHGRFLP